MKNVLAIILGGGRGTRLFPLTKDRSKPAVPLGGKYRLVDIPISNCLNNGVKKIYVLTQFNTASLHMHINRSFNFDIYSQGYIDILAAEQTLTSDKWYEGTADAVRSNLRHFVDAEIDTVMILSGDQLYRMNFHEILAYHNSRNADITVSVLPVEREKTAGFGILKVDQAGKITDFVEKTKDPDILDKFKVPNLGFFKGGDAISPDKAYLASMGIYVFKRNVLDPVLDNDMTDFGKHIIPWSINHYNVFAYPYEGYWEDIGTIKSFYEATLNLTSENPEFDFFDPQAPVYTHPRFLPPSKFNDCTITQSIISEGGKLWKATIKHCVIGIRSTVRDGSSLSDTIMMGQDYYDSPNNTHTVPIGIGKNCKIERTIIDKNARIGDNTTILSKENVPDADFENYYIRDGIVIIPKNAVLQPGTKI